MKYIPPLNGDTGNPNRAWPNANPALGIAGARIDGQGIEHPMRELTNLIAAAGLTPDSNDLTQVQQAIQLLIAAGVSARVANMFKPGPTSPLSMKVQLAAGHVFTDASLTEVSSQQSATLVAPASPNSRIDRIVIDRASGALSVVAGTPAVSPVAPAIPTGKQPVARVLLSPTTTSIDTANITDERDLFALGLGLAAFAGLGADVAGVAGNLATIVGFQLRTANFTFAAGDRGTMNRFYGAGLTGALPAVGTLPDGWHAEVQDNTGGSIISAPSALIYVNEGNLVSSYTLSQGESGRIRKVSGAYILTTNVPPTILSKGFASVAVDDGTVASGTYTPSYVGGSYRKITVNGAITIAMPATAGAYDIVLDIVMGASAGTITTSGATKVDPVPFVTTAGYAYRAYISKSAAGIYVLWVALQ